MAILKFTQASGPTALTLIIWTANYFTCLVILNSVLDWDTAGNESAELTVMTSDSQTFNSIARCMPDTTHLYTKQGDT